MDANFTFPARPQPIPRPSAAQPPPEPVNRESSALRASVLDAALQLGFGANGNVANWMFNNALEEEAEDEEVGSVFFSNKTWSSVQDFASGHVFRIFRKFVAQVHPY